MNGYPLWKYLTVAAALLLSFLFTLPNFFGDSPAVQVSSAKATPKIDTQALERVESVLKTAVISHEGVFLDPSGVKVRFADEGIQLKAKDVLEKQFNPDPQD